MIQAPAGSFVYGPRDIPHTFEVTSEEALTRTIPAPSAPPEPERVAAVAAEHGIEIIGPPGIPA